MKFTLALIALAAADYSQEPAPAAAQEPEYTQEPAQFEYEPRTLKFCLGNCPADSYCQNAETGQCHAPLTQYSENGQYGEQSVVGQGCPEGTINLQCSRTGSRIALWIAFGLLFLPSLKFWYNAFNLSIYE